MRRWIPLLACAAALAAALPAGATLQPVRRDGPRVRPGTIQLQPANGRVRVIAELAQPPLAQEFGRSLFASSRRKLTVHSTQSQEYLARLERVQAQAVSELRAAIPHLVVQERFRILLDGLTLSLPARQLPALLRQHEIARVYPNVRYTLADDTSPGVIGADVLQKTAGADGTGLKIAVVDDGIDQTNAFFDPKGFSYPAGFPKGDTSFTTPKVIVAKVFPSPESDHNGHLPLDPDSSFHGTHVAGIAAGDAGTTAPAGGDHPQVTGLTGVAPKAWLGNYRVFTVPTPIGHVANTPEIIEAFEAAVADGMDVINFSGGGAQTDPANDALVTAVENVAAAGVVPVIAAGNDRDDFGDGSVGSPATAPDAIAVAAVSNTHVFAPPLTVEAAGAPADLKAIPFQPDPGGLTPPIWSSQNQTLVDVGSITGTDGKAVERHLCGPPGALASEQGTLPAKSLDGAIALVQRGLCPFVTKAAQAKAAGAVGIVISDNREGEANPLPIALALPGGAISNLDGDRLRAFMAGSGGRTQIQIAADPAEIDTGRSGIVTSFSSSGPTAFGHDLKPDVSAPGGQILSSTLPTVNTSGFAVFDGTSMATPHVSGAAALLLQLHPTWTPAQVKSALVSTAGPAWKDTARTTEAPVTLEGGGLVALPAAASPGVFSDPVSLSFEDLNVADGAASKALLTRISDAGSGSGTWTVTLAAQAATAGTSLDFPGTIALAPGGEVDLSVVANAAAGATPGENYGFLVLRKGSEQQRIPYFFLVDKPALASATVVALAKRVSGTTATGTNRVSAYRYPVAPFKNAPDTPPMQEDGDETVYQYLLQGPVVNAGVSVEQEGAGVVIDPFFLGSLDENQVQGDAGTPVDVNGLTYDYGEDVQAAGVSFPRVQRFDVAVDSPRDRYSGKLQAGTYTLRFWTNDLTPPSIRLLTSRVAVGRPTLAMRTTDSQSGVDDISLTVGYKGMLAGASAYDDQSGVAVFRLPESMPALTAGTFKLTLASSDFEEAKNIDTVGTSVMPNTRTVTVNVTVVKGPAVDWLEPAPAQCLAKGHELLAAGSSIASVRSVRFLLDSKQVATARKDGDGTWSAKLPRTPAKGHHVLAAALTDAKGRTATALLGVKGCG
ncbi:MAG TPA: S8 family serine peptidase [Gaiellaceae bacterium]|nr:S8 family serine peptidase [Gaiellaceae bacterium]